MKRFLFTLSAGLLISVFSASAQPQQGEPNEAMREKYVTEIRQYKHDYLARELELTREQQKAFFPVYDEMEDRIMKLNGETRDLERKTLDNAQASDTELEAAAKAVFAQKLKEGEIESSYFDKFKEILTNRQILRLKNTERKFTQSLMKHHRQFRHEKAGGAGALPGKRQK